MPRQGKKFPTETGKTGHSSRVALILVQNNRTQHRKHAEHERHQIKNGETTGKTRKRHRTGNRRKMFLRHNENKPSLHRRSVGPGQTRPHDSLIVAGDTESSLFPKRQRPELLLAEICEISGITTDNTEMIVLRVSNHPVCLSADALEIGFTCFMDLVSFC